MRHTKAVVQFDEILDTLAALTADKVVERLQESHPGVRPRLLSVSDAATYLGRTVQAVRHLIASGRLKPVRIDRRVSLDLRDLDVLIEESKEDCSTRLSLLH